MSENFSSCVDKGEFPNSLKHTDIVPVHKEKSKIGKTNYMPVRVLSNLFKLYEKQPFRGVLRKKCSENMQQIYRRTPMPKSDFNNVA